MGYLLLVIEALAFSLQFIFNKSYQKRAGGGLVPGGLFMILHGLCVIIIFGIAYGFRLSVPTLQGFLYSVGYCAMSALCSICFLTAVKSCKMAVVTTFELVGSQVLPFIYGMIFSNGAEKITWISWVGFAALIATCLISVPKDESHNGGKMSIMSLLCCLGTFVGNGMISVISDMNANSAMGTPPETFLILNAAIGMVIGAIFALTNPKKLKTTVTVGEGTAESQQKAKIPLILLLLMFAAGYAIMNGLGNLFQQFCAKELNPAIHFPILNALILIIMPFIGLIFFKEKLTKRMVISAVVASFGIVLFMVDTLIFA